MFRHMAALRLRLMWEAGVRSWLDPVQLGPAKSLVWAVAVGAFGNAVSNGADWLGGCSRPVVTTVARDPLRAPVADELTR